MQSKRRVARDYTHDSSPLIESSAFFPSGCYSSIHNSVKATSNMRLMFNLNVSSRDARLYKVPVIEFCNKYLEKVHSINVETKS
jgi:hypothetical protein